jgi:membrane protease YdiL (CAAX protease family)
MDQSLTSMEKNRGKTVLIIILTLAFALVVLFWTAVQVFQPKGLLPYFMQLGLYAVFFLLAWWGLKQERIILKVDARLILQALAWSIIGWLIYMLLFQLLGLARLPEEFKTLMSTPAWKIGKNILGTWVFVGMAEEVLFRGYILQAFFRHFTGGTERRRMVIAVLVVSAFFSLWHLPNRTIWLATGQIDPILFLISFLYIFLIGVGYAYLFVRSNNILLVGLVHGLSDYPLVGLSSQMTPAILVVAILCVEITRWTARKKVITVRP